MQHCVLVLWSRSSHRAWCHRCYFCTRCGVVGAVITPAPHMVLSLHLHHVWCCHCACTMCGAVIVPALCMVLQSPCHCAARGAMVAAVATCMELTSLPLQRAWW